jgi:hypothetical protein
MSSELDIKRRPRVLIADIAFTEYPFPVRRMTGVFPCSPQVRPATRSAHPPPAHSRTANEPEPKRLGSNNTSGCGIHKAAV